MIFNSLGVAFSCLIKALVSTYSAKVCKSGHILLSSLIYLCLFNWTSLVIV